MTPIHVVPIGDVERTLLDFACAALRRQYRTECSVVRQAVDPAFAFHAERNQFHSTALVEHLARHATGSRILGVAAVDLYVPILTFVFGEAQLGGSCAVVSSYRLEQELYGLTRDVALLRNRIVKEAVHEIGHTCGLTHCDDYSCAMAASHSVEWLDIKAGTLCENCSDAIFSGRDAVHYSALPWSKAPLQ
jgi:archaemetzincin